jgi:hypothetical protein
MESATVPAPYLSFAAFVDPDQKAIEANAIKINQKSLESDIRPDMNPE